MVVAVTVLLSSCLSLAQEGPMVGEVPQDVEDRFVENPDDLSVETWVSGLEIPWGLVFLSEDRALVTERPGRVRQIRDGRLTEEPYLRVDALHIGEGGLMGIEKHPDFPEEPYIYVMYTTRGDAGRVNLVERYRDEGDGASFDRVIVDDIPAARFHNGGRIKFGPDGKLYITAGENFDAELAQNLDSLGGSILRVNPDGSIPADNPFTDSPIYSYGHRNPQGLAWHPETGALFSSEHGPSREFGLHGYDIINVIEKGENYGWPRAVGAVNQSAYVDPIVMWERPTPPAGLAFWQDDLYLATLGSSALMRIDVRSQGDGYRIETIERLFATDWYAGTYGRLRAAVVGPDGALYVTTSNRDGRGDPRSGDDRILRITPAE
jgi:quinoprotein glucose dehydrogenase